MALASDSFGMKSRTKTVLDSPKKSKGGKKMFYIVYGKHKNEKRFRPFDMNGNRFVTNLIHATVFESEQLPRLKKEVAYMNKYNPDYVFEIRKR